MTVYFIGAGPGAADLITVRGQRLVARCPVVLYAGALVPRELLDEAAAEARLVDTANLTLDEIVATIAEADAAGADVARLQSGDLSIFSAVAEQVRRLDALGIAYELVPGVPAFAAAAAALGRELTVPTVGQSVVLTRIARRATPMPANETLEAFAASGALQVLHLATQAVDDVVARLTPFYGPDCPAAVVAYASQPREVVLRGTLADIADQVHEAGLVRSAVILVGRVLAAETFPDSHLYSAARERHTCSTQRVTPHPAESSDLGPASEL
ncbi:precorrin-4/cobalt-precorrin-4 C11-methyltransferase [Kineosphaera limosa]|uniref:Precorrin-4 C11-methyltransferase n=1 Tax=Kineosphaera limosa NBRC 100340 TaxID=1184609 RepID=K6XCJ6_9MICO|nr:precorrin-4 C(11)-methyltransferase [Kineosphaera limosa]NYD99100.1 precorrin-4/cobalt-precorrin-4 C11-methyltransferase [Kineosphaera limosa]GAB96539.1 precorrin-4 C11-methyltransferase [Kineosphaera limosa NBRC 100340]